VAVFFNKKLEELYKTLDETNEKGLTVVDINNAWEKIYPFCKMLL
jgi:hypothetical protein